MAGGARAGDSKAKPLGAGIWRRHLPKVPEVFARRAVTRNGAATTEGMDAVSVLGVTGGRRGFARRLRRSGDESSTTGRRRPRCSRTAPTIVWRASWGTHRRSLTWSRWRTTGGCWSRRPFIVPHEQTWSASSSSAGNGRVQLSRLVGEASGRLGAVIECSGDTGWEETRRFRTRRGPRSLRGWRLHGGRAGGVSAPAALTSLPAPSSTHVGRPAPPGRLVVWAVTLGRCRCWTLPRAQAEAPWGAPARAGSSLLPKCTRRGQEDLPTGLDLPPFRRSCREGCGGMIPGGRARVKRSHRWRQPVTVEHRFGVPLRAGLAGRRYGGRGASPRGRLEGKDLAGGARRRGRGAGLSV